MPQCRRLPPELWDCIITLFSPGSLDWEVDVLRSDTIQDLKSCSLVSKALLGPAQSLLFRSIDLEVWALEYALTYCRQLAAIFEKSLHLANYVQSISAPADAEIFGLVSNMKLFRLRDIRIEGPWTGGGDIDGPVLELVQAAIGEGIRHVRFSGFDHLSYAAVVSIIAKTPHLYGLHFYDCTPGDAPPANPSDLPTSQRTKIRQLSLAYSPDIAKWLVHPGFPLDFTGLVCANVLDTAREHVKVMLERAQKTMKCLIFMAGDLMYGGLMLYPAVTDLRIHVVEPIDILETLPILVDITKQNAIQQIIYTLVVPLTFYDDPQETSRMMHEFDKGIAALPLTALKGIQMRVFAPAKPDPEDLEFQASESASNSSHPGPLTPESFPLLNDRGLLSFTTKYC
ncbi:hypothetical protein C8R44DRAFT_250273 [Mycena epipterygia]|nr:hypothetical protein C8R44DRAFT_250273 [Mycena epipterygia]